MLLPASSVAALQAHIKKYDAVVHAQRTAEQEYQDASQAVADQSQVVDTLGQVAETNTLSIQRDRWQQEVAALQSDHKAALAGHQQSTTLLAEKRAKLQVLQQQMGDIAHTEAAHQSRQTRDTAWQNHEAVLKAPSLSQGTLAETIRHARASLQELHTAWKQAERDIAAVGGDDQVARLEETRCTLLLDMQEKAENYLSLKFGIAAAERALSQYRNTHQSAMLHKANEAFTTITCSNYRTLSTIPDKDQRETLVAHMANGRSKSVDKMSKGTAMQLYLALRIAGYHEFIKNREPLPFVADDILETFDDDRSAETFKLLCDLSKHGQVIYLTHHAHLCAMAREVCGNKVAIHPCGETILTTP